nr:hypothetical protein [uncultured Acetobacterium sp.]
MSGTSKDYQINHDNIIIVIEDSVKAIVPSIRKSNITKTLETMVIIIYT